MRGLLFDTSQHNLVGHTKWVSVASLVRSFVPDGCIRLSSPVRVEDVTAVHSSSYVTRFLENQLTEMEMRRIGFSWNVQAKNRVLHTTGATVEGARLVAAERRDGGVVGAVCVLGGGAHHAHHDFGSGFCVFNDIAVAAAVLRRENPQCKVLCLDLDVHQGDGTAAMLAGVPGCFTVSMHAEKNFPLHKQKSSIDVELEDGTEDQEYLARLSELLALVEEQFIPDFTIYQGGVDVLQTDRLGRLHLTVDGVGRRDQMVVDWCVRLKSSFIGTMGGGYPGSHEPEKTIRAHAQQAKIILEGFS